MKEEEEERRISKNFEVRIGVGTFTYDLHEIQVKILNLFVP